MISFTDYLKKYEIFSFAFKYIISNNVGAYNPYHSTFHLIDVFTKCMEMSDTYKLSEKDILELGIAALFHDFNHSGGKLKDEENIELAVSGFHDFFVLNKDLFTSLMIDNKNIISLIKITEYPHKRKPNSVKEMILIDSDMIQCYNKNWFLSVITGFLMKEIGMGIEDAINNQIRYIESVNYYTDYAKSIHTEEKNKMLNTLNYFKNIYK